MKQINIRNERDFDRLRVYEDYKPLSSDGDYGKMNITINILNDIYFTRIIKPFQLEDYNIILNGNNKTLSHLIVDNQGKNTGLFSSVNMILVKDLNINGSVVRGYKNTGILVGFCENDTIFRNVNITGSMVISKAFSGSLVGMARNVNVDNCLSESFITGIDYVGGFAGTCLNYNEINSLSNPTFLVMLDHHDNSVGFSKTKNITNDDDRRFRRHRF